MNAPAHRIELATRAVRDLRKLSRPDRERIREALAALAVDADNLDVKALTGRAPWLRMRVGDWRVLYRPLLENETGGSGPRRSRHQPPRAGARRTLTRLSAIGVALQPS